MTAPMEPHRPAHRDPDVARGAGGPALGPLGWLGTYLLGVFLGGALVAPWLWMAAQAAAHAWPTLAPVAAQPFHRYVNRCLLALALLGLWPLWKALRLRSRNELGWAGPWQRPLILGSVLGAAALGLIVLAALAVGQALPNPEWQPLPFARRIASSLATAALVAALEETLFRGVVHSALRRSLPFAATAAVTAVLYALVHFFDRPPPPAHVGALSGLWTLGQMLRGLARLEALLPGLLNLLAVGWMLALARERSGSLVLPIGIHAGWILAIKTHTALVVLAPGANPALWGSHKIFDGWAASLVLAAQLVVVHAVVRRSPGPGAA